MISGKVVGTSIDDNGNIKVETEYTLTDGSKQMGRTRFNFLNFSQENILKDIKAHCETLMMKTYGLKAHQTLVEAGLPVAEYQCTSMEVIVKPEVKDAQGNVVTPAETITIDDK